MPLSASEFITKLSVLVYHDVELKDVARYRFDAVSFASYDSSIPIGSVYIDGDVVIRQSWPLDVKGGYVHFRHMIIHTFILKITHKTRRYRTPYDGDDLISISGAMSASELAFQQILAASTARNCK
jgi:hypothetical protein